MTNVKNYTDEQLIARLKSLPSYKYIPKRKHVIVVRSNEDAPDKFDDKMYLFEKGKGLSVLTCTTNTGVYGLLNFTKWNKLGAAVIKSDEIYYNAFKKSNGKDVRHHNGKMHCLRQIRALKYYRDNDKDNKAEEIGKVYEEIAGTNIHCNTYKKKSGFGSWLIGRWSVGCIVTNEIGKYYRFLRQFDDRAITVTVLKEF